MLRGWFKQVNTYLRKSLKEQGFITREEAKVEWNDLYEKGRFLLRERYKGHVNRIFDEVKFLADQFDKDVQNRAFAESVKKLFKDIGVSENGKVTVAKNLGKDFLEVIFPEIFANIRYIPISRIEVSDPNLDAVVENLVIETDNLFPNVLEIDSDNYMRWGRKTIPGRQDHKVYTSFTLQGILVPHILTLIVFTCCSS